MERMTEQQAEIIKALADCDLNVSKVAEKLHYHKNTIYYQIGKIREETGADPLSFYGLAKLLGMIL